MGKRGFDASGLKEGGAVSSITKPLGRSDGFVVQGGGGGGAKAGAAAAG